MRRPLFALCLLAGIAAGAAAPAQAGGGAPRFEMPGLVNALVTTSVAQVGSKDARIAASRAVYYAAFAVALHERWGMLPTSSVVVTRARLERMRQDGAADPGLSAEEVREVVEIARRDAETFTGAVRSDSIAGRNAAVQLGRLISAVYPARQSPSSQLRERRIAVRMSPTWE